MTKTPLTRDYIRQLIKEELAEGSFADDNVINTALIAIRDLFAKKMRYTSVKVNPNSNKLAGGTIIAKLGKDTVYIDVS